MQLKGSTFKGPIPSETSEAEKHLTSAELCPVFVQYLEGSVCDLHLMPT